MFYLYMYMLIGFGFFCTRLITAPDNNATKMDMVRRILQYGVFKTMFSYNFGLVLICIFWIFAWPLLIIKIEKK